MNTLFLVPARGGSKGLPGKSTRLLAGRPLILYTTDFIRKFAGEEDICLTTDSAEIIDVVEKSGMKVHFRRPDELATDTSPSYDFIMHALGYFEQKGKRYDRVVLLQATSPFRNYSDLEKMLALYSPDIDMIVSVKRTRANPYFMLYEENEEGFLVKSKPLQATRRQDCPEVWELNGSVYLMNAESLRKSPPSAFTRIRRYEMQEIYSVDIDSLDDFLWAEFLLSAGRVRLEY